MCLLTEIWQHVVGDANRRKISRSSVETSAGKELIMAMLEELYNKGGLRMVPEVALAKFISMNIGNNDNFIFEIFGHVAPNRFFQTT